MLKIGICGICGKMGKRIAVLAGNDDEVEVSSALEWEDHPMVGKDMASIVETTDTGVKITNDAEKFVKDSECVIDFTLPDPTLEHLEVCVKNGIPMVIGTTGMTEEGEKKIKEASSRIPIVFAPNMSAGVNLMFKIVKEATKALYGDFTIEVDETHHIHKKDSPSGTAKMIAKVIAEAGAEEIPVEAFREGEVIGNHGVVFESDYETLEIRHNAKTRDVFAAGAIKAAKYVADKAPGMYSMADVLGIK